MKKPGIRRAFVTAGSLLAEGLSDGRVLEHAGQGVAEHLADQLAVGRLVRRHAEALVQGGAVATGVAPAAVLHVGAEGRGDVGLVT